MQANYESISQRLVQVHSAKMYRVVTGVVIDERGENDLRPIAFIPHDLPNSDDVVNRITGEFLTQVHFQGFESMSEEDLMDVIVEAMKDHDIPGEFTGTIRISIDYLAD